MLTHDLNVTAGRPHTPSGIPGESGPTIDGVYKLEDDSGFYLTAANDYLAFETAETALWTPRRISTLSWHDISDNSTITEAGGVVTSIADKSGNGISLTANSASTNNHTLLSASQNGLDVVDLDGDDRYNATSGITVPNGNISFFIVCKVDVVDSTLDSILATTGTNSFQYQASSATDFLARLAGPNSTTSTTNTDYKGAYHIFNAVFDFDGSNYDSRVDGALEGTASYTTQLSTSLNLRVFTNRGQGAYPEGQLAEIVICTDVSTTTRQLIEGYLAHKWGIDGNLDSLHPYALSAPTI